MNVAESNNEIAKIIRATAGVPINTLIAAVTGPANNSRGHASFLGLKKNGKLLVFDEYGNPVQNPDDVTVITLNYQLCKP